MTDLLLRRVSDSRPGAEAPDDYDVIGADGLIIGRIFKATQAPVGTPWSWALAYGNHELNHEEWIRAHTRGGDGGVR
jgi:hypothetical protein